MNFNDTPEQAEFRAEVHSWLEQNAEPKTATGRSLFGRGSDED